MSTNNIESIKNIIYEAEEMLKKGILLTLEEANNDSSTEDDLIFLWTKHGKDLNNFFIKEAEKSGNSRICKKVIKNIIFKKF